MAWIKIAENLYAKEPEPDPEMIVDVEQLQQDIEELEKQLEFLNSQLEAIKKEIEATEAEIVQKRSILEEIQNS